MNYAACMLLLSEYDFTDGASTIYLCNLTTLFCIVVFFLNKVLKTLPTRLKELAQLTYLATKLHCVKPSKALMLNTTQ